VAARGFPGRGLPNRGKESPLKLYLNKTSPYARLTMVVAREKDLVERLALEWTDPWTDSAELLRANPFSRVPTLVTDDGLTIVDSA